MDIDECYRALGLQPGASADELKTAWLDLAKVWHPDRFSGDPRLHAKAEAKLKEINNAYERLKDINRKATRSLTTSARPFSQGATGDPLVGDRWYRWMIRVAIVLLALDAAIGVYLLFLPWKDPSAFGRAVGERTAELGFSSWVITLIVPALRRRLMAALLFVFAVLMTGTLTQTSLRYGISTRAWPVSGRSQSAQSIERPPGPRRARSARLQPLPRDAYGLVRVQAGAVDFNHKVAVTITNESRWTIREMTIAIDVRTSDWQQVMPAVKKLDFGNPYYIFEGDDDVPTGLRPGESRTETTSAVGEMTGGWRVLEIRGYPPLVPKE